MSVKIKKESRLIEFFKKFWPYIVAGMLAIAIGVTLGVAAAVNQKQSVVDVVKPGNENSNDNQQDPTPIDKTEDKQNQEEENKPTENEQKDEKEVSVEPVTFAMPMTDASVLVDYNDSKLVYNPTLDRWESHFYIDLTSNDLNVYSVLDGKVESVSYDYLTGYVVKIKHDDGLTSVYASLGDDVSVKKGDEVKRGQKIGNASNLAASSSEYGNHLEFSLLQNDQKIDPNNYLDLQNK